MVPHFHRRAAALAMGIVLVGLTSACADDYYDHPGYARGYNDPAIDAVCSNGRARELEGRLRHAVDEGRIDPRRADDLHAAIDRLENRAGQECAEHDTGSVHRIADEYNGLAEQIERSTWRRNW